MNLENGYAAKQEVNDEQNSTQIKRNPQLKSESLELILEAKQDMLDAEGWIRDGRKFAARGNMPMAGICYLAAGYFTLSALVKIWRAYHPYTEKDWEEFNAAMEKSKDPAYPYGDDLRRPPTWEIPYPKIERRELFPWEETNAAKGITREPPGGEKGLVGMRMALQAHKDKLKALAEALQITPSFLRDKFMTEQTNLEGLESSFPQPGQLPQDHIPIEMQVTRDKNLEIDNAANSREGLVEEPRRIRQTRGGSKGPDTTKFRSDPGQDDFPGPTSAPIFAPTPPPDHTPPASSEFIPPTQRSQNPPPKYRFSGPFSGLSPATAAALAAPAYAPPASGAAAPGATQVIIKGILPPPSRLSNADFDCCMQREINQIVTAFDTGMRG